MLYDPKWEQPSLTGLISWLERQNPATSYDYMAARTCAFGQYLAACGREHVAELDKELWEGANYIAQGIGHPTDWTFGRALERARAALTASLTETV